MMKLSNALSVLVKRISKCTRLIALRSAPWTAIGILRRRRYEVFRLSTIRNADLILVMNEGSIVEYGAHEGLFKQEGIYANLVRNQLETRTMEATTELEHSL